MTRAARQRSIAKEIEANRIAARALAESRVDPSLLVAREAAGVALDAVAAVGRALAGYQLHAFERSTWEPACRAYSRAAGDVLDAIDALESKAS